MKNSFFSPHQIQQFLKNKISELLDLKSENIDIDESFANYGLGSFQIASLSGDLSNWLQQDLNPTIFWDFPSIKKLSESLFLEKTRMDETQYNFKKNNSEHVAIIGMACRFPGANNLQEFWNLLKNGQDAITEVPLDRFLSEKINKSNFGGFLKEIDKFDNNFFHISSHEAQNMDPQQRLLLELVVEGLEDAGYPFEKLAGSNAGVFIGIASNDYGRYRMIYNNSDIFTVTGNSFSISANRISYFFDLHGPSIAIDTACSSSLVAVYLASQAIKNRECEIAIAGGVNILLDPQITNIFERAGMLSPDGRCKSFDKKANGYVRGEGGGIIILKRLRKAIYDRDDIYAVICGGAINQDGRTNGLTAPNRYAQIALLMNAYKKSRISPVDVQYVETHGTGTELGDPIEIQALGEVLGVERTLENICLIGSVKTNIGHLEAAAGIASVIKVGLSLKYKAIPPSLHYDEPNPLMNINNLSLKVQNVFNKWPEQKKLAMAGINSFGFGGTNAHIVLSEAPIKYRKTQNTKQRKLYLIPFSAASQESLRDFINICSNFFKNNQKVSLNDIAYTLTRRRAHYSVRKCFLVKSKDELVFELTQYSNFSKIKPPSKKNLVFVFSGQGDQWFKMGEDLFYNEPLFKKTVQECDKLFSQYIPEQSVLSFFNAKIVPGNFNNTLTSQIITFSLQVALVSLWNSWGIKPDAVIGHSMGEITAAYVSGGLTLEQAVFVIANRALLMDKTKGCGMMAAVQLSAKELKKRKNKIWIAANNGPKGIVVSGSYEEMKKFLTRLSNEGVLYKVISDNYAFHSPLIEFIIPEYRKILRGIKSNRFLLPMYSTVTGKRLEFEYCLDENYWCNNLISRVSFYEAIDNMLKDGYNLFLEVGPHKTLNSRIYEIAKQNGSYSEVMFSLEKNKNDWSILNALAKFYNLGYSINWQALYNKGLFVKMPTYPWQKKRFWLDINLNNFLSEEKSHNELFFDRKIPDFTEIENPQFVKNEDKVIQYEDELQTLIVAMWEDLLGCTNIDINDNFFEIGGNSLLAIRFLDQLQNVLSVSIPMKRLFGKATVASLSEELRNIINESKMLSDHEASEVK